MHWNERLIDYCFRSGTEADGPVERIPATPEELVEIVGDSDADPDEVTKSFANTVRANKGDRSFEAFCRGHRFWTPASREPPKFFAALWLTCLVAYGFPRNTSGVFGERLGSVLGASANLRCLPELWDDMELWTRNVSGTESGFRPLRLPPEDTYRTNIGHSWFLAYPHRQDRRRLRELLEQQDLVGDEPPLEPVLKLLTRNKDAFEPTFRRDLEEFSTSFIGTRREVRDSPFWRAIRQEALAPAPIRGGSRSATKTDPNTSLMAEIDDDDVYVYVACVEETQLPTGYSMQDFGYELDGFANYVQADESGDAEKGVDHAALAALDGEIPVPRAAMYARRGVLPFQEMITNEYRLAGGAQANGAGVALVEESLVGAFKRAYGGRSRPSRLPGWHQVTECKIRIEHRMPRGLERVKHLQQTMIPPSIRLVGGIRTGKGFYAFPGFLPRIRFDGAEKVELWHEDGSFAGIAERVPFQKEEWRLPRDLDIEPPMTLLVRAKWSDGDGHPRASETPLIFQDRTTGHDYKPLASGRYFIESCGPGEKEIVGKREIPITLPVGDPGSYIASATSTGRSTANQHDVSVASGVKPDYRATHVADALAALSVRRSGIPRRSLFELFAGALDLEVGDNPVLFYDLVRGWMESGAIDVALAQGRKESVICARSPAFVCHGTPGHITASLMGVVPSALGESVKGCCESMGVEIESILPPCRWLPEVLRLEADSIETVEEVSRRCDLRSPQRLRWPMTRDSAPVVHPEKQDLRAGPAPTPFETVKQWNWARGRFVRDSFPKGGIRIQRRSHPEHSSLYVVVADGEDEAWTYIRNWALLYAEYLNKDLFEEDAPVFTTRPGGPIVRDDEAYIYLPLPVGRLCAILGDGLSGPVLDRSEQNVEGYVYPLPTRFREPLEGWLEDIGSVRLNDTCE